MKKNILVPVIAVIIGFIGVGIQYQSNRKREKVLTETVTVVVSGIKLKAGEKIRENKLLLKKVPKRFLPKGAVLEKNRMSLVNRKVLVAVEAGQVMLWNYLDVSPADFGIASRIKPGQRAITVSVDRASGLESMLRPGHHVDILATFNIPDKKRRRVTRTLLQNVTVLALGNDSQKGPYSTVTFQVSPAEAELIAFADRVAEMRLVLRNNRDVVIQKGLPVIDFSNLIQVERKIRQKQKSGTRPRIIYD